MLLGGGYYGQRLNKIYRGSFLVYPLSTWRCTPDHHPWTESVNEQEILAILRPMIKRYALERQPGERFGDWTIRARYIAPTTEGRLWYENSGGEGINKEGAVVAAA